MKKDEIKTEDLQNILQIATEFNMKEDEERSFNAIGLRYHKAGNYEEALKNYEKALSIAQEIGDIAGKGMILNNIGYIKWAQKDFDSAMGYFKDSIDIYEQFIGEIQTSVEKIDISDEFNPYYSIIELLFDIYKDKKDQELLYEALKYIELAKSIEIIDLLQSAQIIEKYPIEEIELVKSEKSLINDMFIIKEEINEANKRKREIWGILHKYKGFEDQETIKNTIQSLENELENLKSQINEKNELLLELGKKSRILRIELMKKLKDPGLIKSTKEFNPFNEIMQLFEMENIVIWELFYIPDTERYKNKFNVLVIDVKKIELFEVYGFDGEFLESFKIFRKMMSDPVLKYHSLEKLTIMKDELIKILPHGLLKTLENKSKLILIPHSILHYIPWEIIDPISLKIPFCRNYSLRILNACIKKDIAGTGMIFINNPTFNSYPLTIAEKEITNIKQLLDDYKISHEIISHEKATKEAFLKEVKEGDHGVIHFGSYSNFDPLDKVNKMTDTKTIIENCISSGLLFYNEKNYELMRINELINTSFKTSPLFIINDLEYGAINDSGVDCSTVLIRGLILAGVTGIIIPNWEIMEDITPSFMLEFYHNVASELDICESLFESRKKIKSDFNRPVLYGVYSLYGNPFKKIKLE